MIDTTISLVEGPLTTPLLTTRWWDRTNEVSVLVAASVDANSRAMQTGSFDAAEMSFATFLHARCTTGVPLLALPAFTGRRLTQPMIGVSRDGGVASVDELRGGRVAAPQYWMTSSVWHREVLESYYGISPSELSWVTCADERFDLAPAGVDVCRSSADPVSLVESGYCAAALMPRPPRALRSPFANATAEGHRFVDDTGITPIMHLVVVRADLLDRRPDVVSGLWRALGDARARVPGALPYGLQANRASVAALVDRAVAERILAGPIRVEDLFVADDVLELSRKVSQ